MSFVQYLNHGKVGESIVAQWLRSRGYNVLPIYEKELDEKKGPALYACTGSFVAPDMLVFRSGSLGHDPGGIRWIEAKTKSAFTWHRQTEQWTTGIDKRLYRNYLQVMKAIAVAVMDHVSTSQWASQRLRADTRYRPFRRIAGNAQRAYPS